MSSHTVSRHIEKIYKKMQVHSRSVSPRSF
ncbi:LuxR C-terminal-related transcriptional regulator [Leptospira gomenensis]